MLTTAITNITIIGIMAIFSIALFENIWMQVHATASTAVPFIHIFASLTPDKIQFLPNQIMFHLDNQTSGAIESISNETGKNVTQYFKYNSEQNTVTVSNSTIYIHYNLQIPNLDNPNAISIEGVNRAFNVQYIANPDPRLLLPSTTYFGEINSKFLSINGITYDKLNIQVIIPHDLNKYQSLMMEYPSMNK
ncbi:MAG: hypothetical protein ABJB73_08615 [Candidatus Nitrosocosmicus sp.]